MRLPKHFWLPLLASLVLSPACSKPDSALPVAQRIPVSTLCSRQKHETLLAAREQNKKNLERVEKSILDVSKDLPQADREVLRRLEIAQLIDAAIDFRESPNKTGNLAAAYGEYAREIESLAGSDWKTLEPTPKQMAAIKAVATAEAMDAAGVFRKAYQPTLPGQFPAMYRQYQASIGTILIKQWRPKEFHVGPVEDFHVDTLDPSESLALNVIQSAQMIDVASATIGSPPSSRSPAVAEAFRANEVHLRTLAQRKPGDEPSPEEQNAVCSILRAYQEGR